jgi:NaMN:DMB phosphoribosyltransferase
MDATLSPVTGGIIATELSRLEKLIAESDAQSGRSRTPAQRRAAALVEMATRSAAMPVGSKKPRPLLTVLVGEQSLSHICELANGTVLSPADLLPMLSTTDFETVLFDGPHTVISVSQARRFTGAIRKAIETRDRHCTHPSDCDVPAERCDVDHIIPFSEHGPTSQFNGRLQCATHNRNASRHAHSTTQPISPPRPITELDHIRCRLRYNYRNNHPDPDSES